MVIISIDLHLHQQPAEVHVDTLTPVQRSIQQGKNSEENSEEKSEENLEENSEENSTW